MSETKTKSRGKSVAAYILLPQFHLSMQGFAHIIPVFIRTLAAILSQAGLIAHNHPATRYGIEGVRKYTARELIGEAWFTLRTTKANAFQWGVFTSIMLMITVMFTAAGTFVATTAFGVGSAAHAQLFEHPGSPYNAGTDTGMDQVEALGVGANPVFDTRWAPGAAASTDWALMVLDKVLRQGAAGSGGATQTALQALMEIYNTGVLVVASIMLFWMIISIVVDTAKTGTIGGGRHNMVWTPIRVVFALGIMIPLGSMGFSSGQYMVMKLAEWGSNLGTSGWVAYIDAVVEANQLVGPINPRSATGIAVTISKIKTCQIAYNAYLAQSGTLDGNMIDVLTTADNTKGTVTQYYTNGLGRAVCGGVTVTNAQPGDIGFYMNRIDGIMGGNSLAATAANFRTIIRGSLTDILLAGGAVYGPAEAFACSFVRRRFSDGGTGVNPVDMIGCGGYACGGSAEADPDHTCQQEMVNTIIGAVRDASAVAMGELDAYINGGPLVAELRARGWGGMGQWYTFITTVNELAAEANHVGIQFTPGSAWTPKDTSDLGVKVSSIVGDFDRWWQRAVSDAANNPAASSAGPEDRSTVMSQQLNFKDEGIDFKELLTSDGSGEGTMEKVASWVMPADSDWFMFDILDSADDPTYPMAGVVRAGDNILITGLSIWGVVTLIQTLIGGFSNCGTASAIIASYQLCWAGASFANSAFMNGLASIGLTLIICGMVIGFYLPLLPMIRVAFAVLTWVISVFEAVCMVPIAALAHLTSEGEGLAGGARTCWILWLNILLRPILVVLGFVGAMLVYNTFIVYFQGMFASVATAAVAKGNMFSRIIAHLVYTIVYVAVLYSAANTIFKMLDQIPNGLMRWLGASPDQSFDQNDNTEGMVIAGSNMMNRFQKTPNNVAKQTKGDKKDPPSTSQSNKGQSNRDT